MAKVCRQINRQRGKPKACPHLHCARNQKVSINQNTMMQWGQSETVAHSSQRDSIPYALTCTKNDSDLEVLRSCCNCVVMGTCGFIELKWPCLPNDNTNCFLSHFHCMLTCKHYKSLVVTVTWPSLARVVIATNCNHGDTKFNEQDFCTQIILNIQIHFFCPKNDTMNH